MSVRVRKHFLRNYFIVCGTHFEVHGAPSVYASSPCVSCDGAAAEQNTFCVLDRVILWQKACEVKCQ